MGGPRGGYVEWVKRVVGRLTSGGPSGWTKWWVGYRVGGLSGG